MSTCSFVQCVCVCVSTCTGVCTCCNVKQGPLQSAKWCCLLWRAIRKPLPPPFCFSSRTQARTHAHTHASRALLHLNFWRRQINYKDKKKKNWIHARRRTLFLKLSSKETANQSLWRAYVSQVSYWHSYTFCFQTSHERFGAKIETPPSTLIKNKGTKAAAAAAAVLLRLGACMFVCVSVCVLDANGHTPAAWHDGGDL